MPAAHENVKTFTWNSGLTLSLPTPKNVKINRKNTVNKY